MKSTTKWLASNSSNPVKVVERWFDPHFAFMVFCRVAGGANPSSQAKHWRLWGPLLQARKHLDKLTILQWGRDQFWGMRQALNARLWMWCVDTLWYDQDLTIFLQTWCAASESALTPTFVSLPAVHHSKLPSQPWSVFAQKKFHKHDSRRWVISSTRDKGGATTHLVRLHPHHWWWPLLHLVDPKDGQPQTLWSS